MAGEVNGGGVRPTIHFSSTSLSYRPSNSNGLTTKGSNGNGSTSKDTIDLIDYIVTPEEMEGYATKEINDSLGIEGAESTEQRKLSWLENFVYNSGVMKVANTYANFWLAMNDGAIQLTEKIADGAIWSTKLLIDVHALGVAKAVSIFNPELGEEMESGYRNTAQDFFKNVIGFSVSDWWKSWISESEAFKIINSNTYLEYGGETSRKISNVSEKIQTVVGAAISSKVWGGCLALMLGGCYGSGAQAEKLYSTRDETGVREELSILFSGGKEAVKWFSIAKITQGITSMFKGAGGSGLGNFAENAKEFGKKTIENFKETNLEVFRSFKRSGGGGLFNPFTKYISDFLSNPLYSAKTFDALTRNFDDYFSGEKEFTVGSLLKDVIYSTSYMLSGAMRLNICDHGDTYSIPQWGLTYLTPKLTDWLNEKFGLGSDFSGGGGGKSFDNSHGSSNSFANEQGSSNGF